jgi:hypothetical protein
MTLIIRDCKGSNKQNALLMFIMLLMHVAYGQSQWEPQLFLVLIA